MFANVSQVVAKWSQSGRKVVFSVRPHPSVHFGHNEVGAIALRTTLLIKWLPIGQPAVIASVAMNLQVGRFSGPMWSSGGRKLVAK